MKNLTSVSQVIYINNLFSIYNFVLNSKMINKILDVLNQELKCPIWYFDINIY